MEAGEHITGTDAARRLRWAWMAGIVVAAAIGLSGRYWLNASEDRSLQAVELVGGQAARAERVGRLVVHLLANRDSTKARELQTAIRPVVRSLNHAHTTLLQVAEVLDQERVTDGLNGLSPTVQRMRSASAALNTTEAMTAVQRQAAAELAREASIYARSIQLVGDRVVRSAREQTAVAASRGLLFELLGWGALIALGLLVFEPLGSRLRRDIDGLQARVAAANRAASSKSAFLANMSHELRTSMAAILGSVDLLDDDGGSDGVRRDATSTIRRNGEHLLEVLRDTVDLSRIVAGRLEVSGGTVDLESLIRALWPQLESEAAAKGCRLEIELEGRVPVTIRSDEARVRQCLNNVIASSLELSRGGTVHVTLGCDWTAEQLGVVVRDSGSEATESGFDRFFDAFSQEDVSTTQRFAGVGLGLTIAREVARRLGGDLRAKRLGGEGSAFLLTMSTGPIQGLAVMSSESLDASEAPVKEAPKAPASLAGRILLVDDVEDNRRLYGRMIEAAGASLTLACDGAEAVRVALEAGRGEQAFDLILMDVQMPVLDGYRATQALRESGFSGPIVALTAHAMPKERQRCLDAGCDGYLSKPVRRRELIDELRSRLESAEG